MKSFRNFIQESLDEGEKLDKIKKTLKKYNITLQASILSIIAGMSPAKLDMLIKGINAIKPLVAEDIDTIIKDLIESNQHHCTKNTCPECGSVQTCRCRQPKTNLTSELCYDCKTGDRA